MYALLGWFYVYLAFRIHHHYIIYIYLWMSLAKQYLQSYILHSYVFDRAWECGTQTTPHHLTG